MAVKALVLGDTFEYVSDKDPSKSTGKKFVLADPNDPSKGEIEVEGGHGDDATIFFLRPLDVFLMGSIYDRASNFNVGTNTEVTINTMVNKTNIEAVRHGLVKVVNFEHPQTRKMLEVAHTTEKVNGREYEVVTDEFMKYLGVRLIEELAGQIKEASEVKEETAKN